MARDDPHLLRGRAHDLRILATELESTPAMSLDVHAGPDTWQIPRAELCRWLLGVNQAQLHREADGLRWSAHRLEQRAIEIEIELARLGGGS